ncbi:hypothetical protein AB6A40_000284 [Gnathostoma spinigerum]|uniref:Uncharacterized protein n=1 Tax=Gnathostoma spinigerum TaxID=75299 RepID=A0ABD6EBB6_9BILA
MPRCYTGMELNVEKISVCNYRRAVAMFGGSRDISALFPLQNHTSNFYQKWNLSKETFRTSLKFVSSVGTPR